MRRETRWSGSQSWWSSSGGPSVAYATAQLANWRYIARTKMTCGLPSGSTGLPASPESVGASLRHPDSRPGRSSTRQDRAAVSNALTCAHAPTKLDDMPRRPVRVAILGINYAPEPTGIAPYTTGLASGLTKRGHDVRVLTGYPHYPQWKRYEGSAGFRSDDEIDGVRIRRFNHHVPEKMTWPGRAAMELPFGLQLLTAGWGRPEVVVCVPPPLLAAAMSAVRGRLTRPRPAIGVL